MQAHRLGLWWALAVGPIACGGAAAPPTGWTVGAPIVTYWCGPALTDATAQQMAEGGWNLVWCGEAELAIAQRHGLRALLTHPLLAPDSLDEPQKRAQLDALIDRVRTHPALYAYFITDEPNAAQFPALGRLVTHLRRRDPAHLAYINLFPTYASNAQLGNTGTVVTAYQAHLRQFIQQVQPGLLSYDHYQFAVEGDTGQYFLNLALVRRAALDARLPFLQIVQASTWTPSMRVPGPDELRYLVYTTLAYGAQGISYYIYCCPKHEGGMASADGTPTRLYHAAKTLNREFVAIARELQPLRSLGVYHAGMLPEGAEALPPNAVFRLDPPVPVMSYRPPERVKGILIGCFGPADSRDVAAATHALVVNLDYRSEAAVGVHGPGPLQTFDPATAQWSAAQPPPVKLLLAGGAGRLVRVQR